MGNTKGQSQLKSNGENTEKTGTFSLSSGLLEFALSQKSEWPSEEKEN